MRVGKISAIAAGPGPENAAIISAKQPCTMATNANVGRESMSWNNG